MYRSATYTTVNGATTAIPFDTVANDPNSNCTVGAGAKYTAPVTGRYLVTGRFSTPATTGVRLILVILQNGGVVSQGVDITGGSSVNITGEVCDIIPCAAGDTLQIAYYTNAAYSADVGAALIAMSVSFIAPT